MCVCIPVLYKRESTGLCSACWEEEEEEEESGVGESY